MAAENYNVFHHLFYEGNVDIFTIEDPLQRNATISFINNFGQIPKLLFKKPHPARKVGFSLITVFKKLGYSPFHGNDVRLSGRFVVFSQ